MKTTLNEIRKHDPCQPGWAKLLQSLGKTAADDEPLDLMHILKSNGIQDAVWALRCFSYKDYCLFLADVIESALPIFEKQFPDDNRPRLAVKSIRDFQAGLIDTDQLIAAADAAFADVADAAAVAVAAAKWKEIEELFVKHFG